MFVHSFKNGLLLSFFNNKDWYNSGINHILIKIELSYLETVKDEGWTDIILADAAIIINMISYLILVEIPS